ncbi:MAG: hypothetical protein VYA25_01795 [Pseudomonadota bacterium]|nr:hypothetical protein [Pseudomonadota bacterium]
MAGGSAPLGAKPSSAPHAKLVHCGAQGCLKISGRRDSTSVIVRVNGEPVLVEGGTRWRTKLPVARLRSMSPRFARTASVTLSNPLSCTETTYEIDLPIGLLGGTTPLAALEVTAW